MSTRCLIAREREDGRIEAIYCHHDGYPNHAGRILREHYRQEEKVKALIALGGLSALGAELGRKLSPRKVRRRWGFQTNTCVAYHRDLGEEKIEIHHFDQAEELLEKAGEFWAEYVYLYRHDSKSWWYGEVFGPEKAWQKL